LAKKDRGERVVSRLVQRILQQKAPTKGKRGSYSNGRGKMDERREGKIEEDVQGRGGAGKKWNNNKRPLDSQPFPKCFSLKIRKRGNAPNPRNILGIAINTRAQR